MELQTKIKRKLQKDINNILELAHKNKCKTIDTASVYDFSENYWKFKDIKKI